LENCGIIHILEYAINQFIAFSAKPHDGFACTNFFMDLSFEKVDGVLLLIS